MKLHVGVFRFWSPLHAFGRLCVGSCLGIFFLVPLPWVTSTLDVKLGDLFITLPACVIPIVISAVKAIQDRSLEGTGSPPVAGLIVVFMTALRNNSPILEITGLSYERALFYHKLSALVTIILSGLHGLAYILATDHHEVHGKERKASYGVAALCAMLLMAVFSLRSVRRRFFELFRYTHGFLFLAVLGMLYAHGVTSVLISIVPWILDIFLRIVYRPRVYSHGSFLKKKGLQGSENAVNGSPRHIRMGVIAPDQLTVSVLRGNIIQIEFPRVRKETNQEFHYKAGQYIFVCVPSVSSFQWHPFSISSSPHESKVSIHIKVAGDWTEKLLTVVSAECDADGVRCSAVPLDILVDGPYGSLSVDLEDLTTYSHVVMFSGGIGVTPLRSVVNWLHYLVHYDGRSELQRIHFVWSTKGADLVHSLVLDKVGHNEEASFFPDKLLTGQDDVFTSELYQTQVEQDLEMSEANRCVDNSCHTLRPDTERILRRIGSQALNTGKKRVAVLVSGPSSMVRDVIRISVTLSQEMDVHFDVHSCIFEL